MKSCIMYQCVYTVPDVPTLWSVNRLSEQNAIISWMPLTLAQARGFLTSLEIAYEPTNGSDCSSHIMNSSSDGEVVVVRQNLTFEQSTADMTGLEPNCEYCVAIQVSTSGGDSGFSNSLKLPCKSDSTLYVIVMIG